MDTSTVSSKVSDKVSAVKFNEKPAKRGGVSSGVKKSTSRALNIEIGVIALLCPSLSMSRIVSSVRATKVVDVESANPIERFSSFKSLIVRVNVSSLENCSTQ